MTDPARDALAALGDFYLKGFAALQSMAGQSMAGQSMAGSRSSDPADAVRTMADLAAGFAGMTPVDGPAAEAGSADMTQALTDAWRIAAVSALRYGQALMEVQTRYQSSLLRAMTDTATPDARMLSDATRGFLREVGEAAEREARRFQMELEQLGEAVARATAQTGTSRPPERTGQKPRSYRVKE